MAMALALVGATVATAAATVSAGIASAQESSTLTSSMITEYPLATLQQDPLQLTTGPDGRLWFTQGANNLIGSVSTGGSFTTWSGLSAPAAGIVADGSAVWVTQPDANGIARISSTGTVTEFWLTSGSKPTAITVGPDGNLWFTEAGLPAQIGRITPSGTVTYFSAGLGPSDAPTSITTGPDGNLWFTASGDRGKIGRITTAGVVTEFTSGLTGGSSPMSITTGPDGNLWFTESAGDAIGRITTTGTITEFTNGLSDDSIPTSITAGPDGNLWFTDAGAPGRIGRITTAGTITEVATPTIGSAPDGITSGPDGRIWFTESGLAGAVGALDLSNQGAQPIPTSPTATTEAASGVGQTSATLNGVVDPEGNRTLDHFDWGTTTSYGHEALANIGFAGGDDSARQESVTLTGLTPGTTYHFRLVATDCGGCQSGTSVGSDMAFATEAPTTTSPSRPAAPVTAPPAPPAGTPATPTPLIGHTAVAQIASGTVLVVNPKTGATSPLAAGAAIPIGSVIDASHGVLKVTTALNGPKQSQTATVWGGSFKLLQNRSTGMVTFSLAGRPDCARAATARRSFRSMTARSSSPKPISLWAHDNHGKYSTRGYNSVATVRGTWWKTSNTCAGTLTYVKRGLVSVRDLRRHRTVLVRAGHSYLARA